MKAEYNVLNSELLYTIIIHFIINRLLATYLKNHTIYGKSFGSHNSKYWCFLQSMVIQSCIFIPSGLLIGSHYNFQSKKIFNSSVENDYSPYSYILSYQIIAYMITTLENCWPNWDLILHHIGGFNTTLFFLYESDSLDIYLLGIMCLETGSFTMNLTQVIQMLFKNNKNNKSNNSNKNDRFSLEFMFETINLIVFTVGHIIGIWFVYEICFIQPGRFESPYFRYWFLFQSSAIVLLRQKAALHSFFSFLQEEKGKKQK